MNRRDQIQMCLSCVLIGVLIGMMVIIIDLKYQSPGPLRPEDMAPAPANISVNLKDITCTYQGQGQWGDCHKTTNQGD